jgi:1-acyl-sn-glycerol-3-phosphate acyltransferase
VLFVANHPNSLMDPAFVCAAADRPVRFLAKAPLFSWPWIGWLIRASGAIPVYRRADDPSAMGRNEEMFAAAHEALSSGAAIGIFPEGLSHSHPALAEMRTGAARIALGAAAGSGGPFPVVPIGIVLREKDTFRTEARALIGPPILWDDLASAGASDAQAVETLTERIRGALASLIPALERWEDAPVVRRAEAVYAAEHGLPPGPVETQSRLVRVAELLSAVRSADPAMAAGLSSAVSRYGRTLDAFGTDPRGIERTQRFTATAGWVLRQVLFFAVAAPIAWFGVATFFVPYQLVRHATSGDRLEPDVRSTHKLLGGLAAHTLWVLALSTIVAFVGGWIAGLAALIALPMAGLITLSVWKRWSAARTEVRSFVSLRRSRDARARLLGMRRDITLRLDAALSRFGDPRG